LRRLRPRPRRYASVAQSTSADSSSTEALLPEDTSCEYEYAPDIPTDSEPDVDIDNATLAYTREIQSPTSTVSPPVPENSSQSYPSLISPVSITTEHYTETEEDEEWRDLGFSVIPIEDNDAQDQEEERMVWVNGFENLFQICLDSRDTVRSIKDKIAAKAGFAKECALIQRLVLSHDGVLLEDVDGNANHWSLVEKYHLRDKTTINSTIHPRSAPHQFMRI